MTKTSLTAADEADIKLLRAAAKKIRTCEIPHVISEERWTARPASGVKGIVYHDYHTFDLIGNVRQAVSWFTKKDGIRSILFKEEDPWRTRFARKAEMAKYSLTHLERHRPDAEVDGNLVHWMEHAIHIALWSPVVTEAVATFLEAEAEARAAGVVSPSSQAAVDLAKKIKNKKVWDTTIETRIPKQTVVADVARLVPAVNKEAIRRLKYMYSKKVHPDVARALDHAYGHQPAHIARKNAERMLQRAERAVEHPSVKAADKRVWKARVKACKVFIEALDAVPEEDSR